MLPAGMSHQQVKQSFKARVGKGAKPRVGKSAKPRMDQSCKARVGQGFLARRVSRAWARVITSTPATVRSPPHTWCGRGRVPK